MANWKHAPGWLAVAALAVIGAVFLVACGESDSTDGGSAGAYGSNGGAATTPSTTTGEGVTISGSSFRPSTLTVKAGSSVTWTNGDGVAHTVTSTDAAGTDAATTSLFDSGTLAQGSAFTFTFDEPGTYYYECTIHASMLSMHGEVIVE